ncbi:MAG: DNA repair exonuclease [Paracoccaceae bacterium]
MFRFLHTSDLHLGKPFGRFEEGLRGRLREARHGVIGRLAATARTGGAKHVLIAGDMFDAQTPSPATVRQALEAMGQAADIVWVLMPGNHDSLAAGELWARLLRDAPGNLVLAREAVPMALAAGVDLLPAPCPVRRPGRDLTEWMTAAASAQGTIRIGLAHGGVTDFEATEEGNPAVIPPDRAERAGLDYLGLGDWHGQMRIGPRCWYSGSPEADGFKHAGPAGALVVSVAAPGAVPEVTPVPTGVFEWSERALDLLALDNATEMLEAVLMGFGAKRDTLLRLDVRGRVRPSVRVALERGFAAAVPSFGYAELRLEALETVQDAADLDAIDRGGALRVAAEALLAEAMDEAKPAQTRAVAAAALSRLYALAGDAE